MSGQSPSVAPASGRTRLGIEEQRQKTLFAGGSVLGALAMSSCCIVPLVLFGLGVTGAWIGALTSLYPYKWMFFVVTAGFLGAGFYRAYGKPRASACPPGTECATPRSDQVTRAALWTATVLVMAALAFPYVAPGLLGV